MGRNKNGHFFSTGSHSNNSNPNFPLPFTLPPELAAHYLSLSQQQQQQQQQQNATSKSPAPATATATATTVFGPSPPPSADAANAANCNGPTAPCSEAEMKALMSMFVDIMGMSMEGEATVSSGANTNGSNKQRPFGRDSIVRLNMAAAAAAAAGNSTSGVNNNGSNNNPFPVFSMMFGGSAAAAAAAAAAANGTPWPNGTTQEEWMMDYYEDDSLEDEDDEDDDEEGCSEDEDDEVCSDDEDDEEIDDAVHAVSSAKNKLSKNNFSPSTDDSHVDESSAVAAELIREEEGVEEERARRAAKKREKKVRKKEKAKREAAIKAEQAAQKKKWKLLQSWKSRVVSACTSDDSPKLDTLLSESPLENSNDELESTMQWLLPSCLPKSKPVLSSTSLQHQKIIPLLRNSSQSHQNSNKDDVLDEARFKLSLYIMSMSFHVILLPVLRNGKSAFHVACAMGDVKFVYLTLQQHRQQNSEIKIHEPCSNSGWTPLHYAAAYGWFSVVELLLSSYQKSTKKNDGIILPITDHSLTNYKHEQSKGVTVRDLLECILYSNIQEPSINCRGDALQEVLTDDHTNHNLYIENLKTIKDRILQVERNGYSPLKSKEKNDTVYISNSNDQVASNPKILSTTSTNTKKKKKKKKSKATNETAQPKKKEDKAPQENKEDPLITALLGMGFAREQIDAAVEACGGTSRATADDLVVWILERNNTTESSDDNNANTLQAEDSNTTQSVAVSTSPPQQEVTNPVEHNIAIQMMQQQRAEAAKRSADAKAAAERLAAKREEQRRIRREWNEREQLRQKTQEKAKLLEQVEKQRRVEIEKAKIEAQQRFPQEPSTNSSTNAGSTLLFPTVFPNDAAQTVNRPVVGNHPVVGLTSVAPVYQSPPMNTPAIYHNTSNYSQTVPQVYQPNSGYNHVQPKQPQILRKKQEHEQPLEVNAFDFPELGKEQHDLSSKSINSPNTPNQKHQTKRNNHKSRNNAHNNAQNNVHNINKQSNKNNNQKNAKKPANVAVDANQNMTPPGFKQAPQSYESNPLGEIRATAKEFVPTSFAPRSQSHNSVPNTASMSSQPDTSYPDMNSSSQAQPPTLDPLYSHDNSQHEPNTASLLEPVNSLLLSNSQHSHILLGTASNGNPLEGNVYHSGPKGHSPVPSVSSSITNGLSATTDSNDHLIASRVGSVMSFDSTSHPSISSTNNNHTIPAATTNFLESMTPLGTIDATPAPSAGANLGSIWGTSTATTSTAAFAGFSAFNFAEPSSASTGGNTMEASSDSTKKANTNTWGSGPTLLNPTGNGGNGSIW